MSEITSEVEKLQAFIEPTTVVAGLSLRPFTAASLIIMRQTGNGLLKSDESNIEFDVAAFLYAHSADRQQVVKTSKDAEAWRDAVMEFSQGMSVRDFVKAASEIKNILEQAMVGQDYAIEGDKQHPNS